jgi:DNA transposition AAA+ family ATPase
MRRVPAHDFVLTPTAERVLEQIRLARDTGSVALFTGPAGVGKTTIIHRFLGEDRDARHLTFTAASKNLNGVLKSVAQGLGVYLNGRSIYEIDEDVRSWMSRNCYARRDRSAIMGDMIYRGAYIVADEIQNINLDALRQLLSYNDEFGVPLIMFGNEHTMKRTRANEAAFDQIDDRIRYRGQVTRTREDIAAICNHLGIEDRTARAWISAYAVTTTLRQLFALLRVTFELTDSQAIGVSELNDALGIQKGKTFATEFLRSFSAQSLPT